MEYGKCYRRDKNGKEKELLYFTRRGCGTNTNFIQITKEEYENYKAMRRCDFINLIESNQDESIICGYGFYGAELYNDEENNLYFLGTEIGSSCD